jgi:hypothetical protein
MKLNVFITALLIIMLSVGISSKSEAAPWRGYYRHGYGYYHPRPAVRVYVPAPVIVEHPHYYGGYGYRHYHHDGYGYRYYGHRDYR